jgi:DEAD/DEAH box helicase domain-containing protein
MIPSVLAEQVQRGVKDFLLTTFPITNPFFEGCLERLLEKKDAVFRGPFLSIKLPFLPATGTAQFFSEVMPAGFQPYRHQQRAFERLDARAGLNSLVATGTGSGKTECFLYPILDHCYRNRGRKGIKAIVIYPMNALATDQAKRFAQAIYGNPELRSYVTAGLYLGGQDLEAVPVMTENQAITDRDSMRKAPPDILLTNYKMLDYLLVRSADLPLWGDNGPETLRYLVVDEMHTFDGAQGADLACLIRRVKERVKAQRGQLVCVGTSATLGDGGPDMARELADYATRVFGEPFGEDGLIGESVLSPDEFLKGCLVKYVQIPAHERKAELDPLQYATLQAYVREQHRLWLGTEIADWTSDDWRICLGLSLKSHAFFRNLLTILEGKPKQTEKLLDEIEKQIPSFGHPDREYLALLLASFVSLVSEAKVPGPRKLDPLVQVRYQFWLRELRRMVSLVGTEPALGFAGDLKPEQLVRSLPVIHCRECGLTGWGATVKDADNKLNSDLNEFYVQFFENSPHVAFVFPGQDFAPQDQTEIPIWLCTQCLRFERAHEAAKCIWCGAKPELSLPVWMPDLNKRREAEHGHRARLEGTHDCPCCGANGSLTIVGSRAASLTSVMIAQLFSSTFNTDKKLLAFSDNVQDASHRAGFFGARTFTFNFRGALEQAVREAGGPVPFVDVTRMFLERWETGRDQARFITTFLPPDMDWLQDYAELRNNGKLPDGSNLAYLLRRRLDWEIWSEYTVDCRIGRTLEKTGCSTLEVRAGTLEPGLECLLPGLQNEIGGLRELDAAGLARFVDGVVLNLKNKGGVEQAEMGPFLESRGNYYHLDKQKGRYPSRPNVSPASRLPVFLTNRPGSTFQALLRTSFTARQSWHENWLLKCFSGLDPRVVDCAGEIYQRMIQALLEAGVFFERQAHGGLVWGLRREIFDVTGEVRQLRCERCSYSVSAGPAMAARMEGAPCQRYGCSGSLRTQAPAEDYYRTLYRSGDVERVFAAEHTGLLERKVRERVEQGFLFHTKPGDPNLLSCTPTLEMGINIGDLSSLALCSVPPKPSNYLQRSGRAGRVDGNAFIMTVANGRPHDLYFFFEPDEMIQGVVETPGCFLNASAVLERQFVAYVFDRWVEGGAGDGALPSKMQPVLDSMERAAAAPDQPLPDAFPWNLLKYFELNRTALERGFLAMFDGEVADYTRARVLEFSRDERDEDPRGFRTALLKALEEAVQERKSLRSRIRRLTDRIRETDRNPAKPQNFEEEIERLRQEKSALNRLAADMSDGRTLEFLADEGLLPNYAFPEAGIVLKSVIYSVNTKVQDPEKKYEIRYYKYQRPASSAIEELAPANNFYAEGRRVQIDQVNLDLSKAGAWRFCQSCTYMEIEGRSEPHRACPKCGDVMWIDDGQRKNMLRMRQVISTTSERESRSYDESDARTPQFYQRNMFVIPDEAQITQAYFLDCEEIPFGFEFFRKIMLREVNFGERTGGGNGTMRIAGRNWVDRPFILCKRCGKVQKKGKIEHALYCAYRGQEEKEQVESACYLYREFNSEAIRMLLPVATQEVDLNIHSFLAALDLGLRKYFHGDPGHLLTTTYDEPIAGSDARKRYLVLYDGVPGGTGYLKELMREPANLMEVFALANGVLANCACRNDPEKDGCYRCLLAYRGRHDQENTSRSAAMRLLSQILAHRDDLKSTERLSQIRLNRLLESELEARFVEALRRTRPGEPERQSTNQVVNGKQGWYLRTPGGSYLVEPQVPLGPEERVSVPSIADFVIWPERPHDGELPIAVFTDGFEYHADPESGNMRVGIDTAQRLAITRSGRFHVWSLTWDDVESQFREQADNMDPPLAGHAGKLDRALGVMDTANRTAWSRAYERASFDWLMFRLDGGRSLNWERHARLWLAAMLDGPDCGGSALDTARNALLDASNAAWPESASIPAGTGCKRGIFRIGAQPLAAGLVQADGEGLRRMEGLSATFRLFDEAAASDRAAWKRAWRAWLRLFNILQFAGLVDFVATAGLREGLYGGLLDAEAPRSGQEQAAGKLAALLADVDAALHPLVEAVAAAGRALPTSGFELLSGDGAIAGTAELAWENLKIAVLMDYEVEYQSRFAQQGWTVYLAAAAAEWQDSLIANLPGGES